MNNRTFFNAHHSPIGAFASLTFGCKGALGGPGLELKGPANESLYIGVEERDRPGRYQALPFYDGADQDGAQDYDVEGLRDFQFAKSISSFEDPEITRNFGAGIDEWIAGDLRFRVASPVRAVPDPSQASTEDLKEALAPSIVAELTIDNRKGKSARKAFFGYAGSERSTNMRSWRRGSLTGVGQGRNISFATDDPSAFAAIAFQAEGALDPRFEQNLNFMLGGVGMLVCSVPAGEIKTFRFAICFFREGVVTTGIEARYLYRRYFDRIEDVAAFALANLEKTFGLAADLDRKLAADLSVERRMMLSHAYRSYLGATQCLELFDGRPLWVVNEGEYRMMNTFDLTVDQLFCELALNPWTVRNVLDFYVERYSYEDHVKFPGNADTYPGGIAFTHDMGIANSFSETGFSCYEQAGLKGVFSYMSAEELVNWALCAALYLSHTKDSEWAQKHKEIFVKVIQSLVNRDHPEPIKRNGVIGMDSSRCITGTEITTYDSLDASLGQARNNLYLALKTWAAYVLLEPVLNDLGEGETATLASKQARLCAKTIVAAADGDGFLPAVLGEGIEARIIPAIEGLIFPYLAGRKDLINEEGAFADLMRVVAQHFDAVLRPGICLFPDGGWRLSSTSRNSWLSKIYLCQFIAEDILGRKADTRADEAHLDWLMDEDNVYFAWSDQMIAGKAHGSRYYPRGVTAVLWLAHQQEAPLDAIRKYLTESGSRDRVRIL